MSLKSLKVIDFQASERVEGVHIYSCVIVMQF